MTNILFDTGAFVALIDRNEHNHKKCIAFLKDFRGKLLTTEPVLTETMYLLSTSIKAQTNCLEFILRTGAILVPQSLESLSRDAELMEKYKDVPMDFADATLVALAEETGISEIFTLDKKGFSIYRINGKNFFHIVP